MSNEEKLFKSIESILKDNGPMIHGEIHLLNVSDEEYVDQYSTIRFRLYHSRLGIFDVIRAYFSSSNDGAGGVEYHYEPEAWDGFESIDEIPIEVAISLIDELKNLNRDDILKAIEKRPNS